MKTLKRLKQYIQDFLCRVRAVIRSGDPTSRIEKKVMMRGVTFHGYNHIGKNSVVFQTELGYGSGISKDSFFQQCKIGKYVCIGPDVKMVIGEHPTHTFASIHPAFYSSRGQNGFTYVTEDKFREYRKVDGKNLLTIGNDVWIGSYSRIMEGVKIGDGAIIAAGAVVTKDVAPYTIVGGVPAKMIKSRFDDETIHKMLDLKWWDQEVSWIKAHADDFYDVHHLLENIGD